MWAALLFAVCGGVGDVAAVVAVLEKRVEALCADLGVVELHGSVERQVDPHSVSVAEVVEGALEVAENARPAIFDWALPPVMQMLFAGLQHAAAVTVLRAPVLVNGGGIRCLCFLGDLVCSEVQATVSPCKSDAQTFLGVDGVDLIAPRQNLACQSGEFSVVVDGSIAVGYFDRHLRVTEDLDSCAGWHFVECLLSCLQTSLHCK